MNPTRRGMRVKSVLSCMMVDRVRSRLSKKVSDDKVVVVNYGWG